MKTKQQKIAEWATGLGYPFPDRDHTQLRILTREGHPDGVQTHDIKTLLARGDLIIGILDSKANVYHPCPKFVDDVEEHELDDLCRDWQRARGQIISFVTIDLVKGLINHIKALEKKLEELGK